MRVALYYAPERDDPLSVAGAAWLGRDPEGDGMLAQPDVPGIAEFTAEPRLYGFHATLKPPMTLSTGALADGARWEDVLDAVRAVAAGIPTFDLPTLAVANLYGFLALREQAPSPALQALADAATAGLDHLRRPAGDAELARRRRAGLSPAQDANLVRWGYPYVFATWTFHMTLTRRLAPEEHARIRPAAEAWFAPALAAPRRVASIAVFTQAPGAAFVLADRIPLAAASG